MGADERWQAALPSATADRVKHTGLAALEGRRLIIEVPSARAVRMNLNASRPAGRATFEV
jgi:hypothetical protein